MKLLRKFLFGHLGVFLSGVVVAANTVMLQGRMEGDGEWWKIALALFLSVVFWIWQDKELGAYND